MDSDIVSCRINHNSVTHHHHQHQQQSNNNNIPFSQFKTKSYNFYRNDNSNNNRRISHPINNDHSDRSSRKHHYNNNDSSSLLAVLDSCGAVKFTVFTFLYHHQHQHQHQDQPQQHQQQYDKYNPNDTNIHLDNNDDGANDNSKRMFLKSRSVTIQIPAANVSGVTYALL